MIFISSLCKDIKISGHVYMYVCEIFSLFPTLSLFPSRSFCCVSWNLSVKDFSASSISGHLLTCKAVKSKLSSGGCEASKSGDCEAA